MTKLQPNEVFKTQGQPTVTYVEREKGKYEKRLSNSIDSKGIISLLTGPSKTGKTTLYTKILEQKNLEPLIIRCDNTLISKDVWKIALEQVNFERLRESSTTKAKTKSLEGKIGGKIGWSWLAGLTGEVKTDLTSQNGEAEIREKILSDPQPSHLIPILKSVPYLLVVEDFHYLQDRVKKTIFQQWKTFTDNEISIVVVGTTHHASDLAHANKDLIGRYTQIDLGNWSVEDLIQIPIKGFGYLKEDVQENVLKLIANESVGLPIVTQSVSLQLLLNKPEKTKEFAYKKQHALDALHDVAVSRFSAFESIYDRLIRGPRKRRKYNTYELVFSTFAQDPLIFSQTRQTINERLKKLETLEGIEKSKIPPQGSVTSMLKAIGTFQSKLELELLEWSERDGKLFIIEPTFLFYLRWRKARTNTPRFVELINEIARDIVGQLKVGFKKTLEDAWLQIEKDGLPKLLAGDNAKSIESKEITKDETKKTL